MIRDVEKVDASMEAAAALWRERMPATVPAATFVRVNNRVLTVRLPDQAARWEAELFLKAGLERAIIAAGKGKIARIKVEVRS